MRKPAVLALVLSTLALSGCLRKETVHTLYLSLDGSVRWVVAESAVYSDQADAGQRIAEEQAYIGPALIGAHTAAVALNTLRPAGVVETMVIRDERPFHVITQARFSRADVLAGRLLHELGVRGRAELTSTGGASTLLVTFDFRREMEEKESAVSRLLQEGSDLRIMLTEGRFLDSPAFDITDRVQASMSDAWIEQAQDAFEARRSIQLRLTWSAGEDKP
jgi:hypothetical protein